MKKTMKQHSFTSLLKSLVLVFGIALTFVSCVNDDLAQNGTTPTGDKVLTAFSTGNPTTRTSMKEDGTFFWEAGDKIYVKDDNGTWNASSNSPTSTTAYFKFKVPGTYTAHNSYEVYYPGKNGANDQVTIPATQRQFAPNTTKHFGVSGDCGMALASRIGTNNQFNFTLDHKAAYLRFLPRTSNTILHNCYLTGVEVTSDNNITATYILDENTGKLIGMGIGKQIKLETGSYPSGFPLTNNTTSATTNGAYMIIKPGIHTLRIRYWVKDMDTNVQGTITKTLHSKNYEQNKYYDITADLQVKDYDGDHYCMWDAQQQCWYGYEWTKHLPAGTGQPTLSSESSSNYPQSNSDPRIYNDYWVVPGISNPATHALCKDIPNANEMTWYAMNGDPRWDEDEVWTTMGHLYKGGMWILKKSYITGFSKEYGYNYTDYRLANVELTSNNISYDLPSVADASKFFYVPALGRYNENGFLGDVGSAGCYWTSTGVVMSAYGIDFARNEFAIRRYSRAYGYRAQKFSDFGDN